MAKKLASLGKRPKCEIPHVELIPIIDKFDSEPLREKELDDLIAQIVLLGRRKPSRSMNREEKKDAA